MLEHQLEHSGLSLSPLTTLPGNTSTKNNSNSNNNNSERILQIIASAPHIGESSPLTSPFLVPFTSPYLAPFLVPYLPSHSLLHISIPRPLSPLVSPLPLSYHSHGGHTSCCIEGWYRIVHSGNGSFGARFVTVAATHRLLLQCIY